MRPAREGVNPSSGRGHGRGSRPSLPRDGLIMVMTRMYFTSVRLRRVAMCVFFLDKRGAAAWRGVAWPSVAGQ